MNASSLHVVGEQARRKENAGRASLARAWAWLRRHRNFVRFAVILTVIGHGVADGGDLLRDWLAGAEVDLAAEVPALTVYFFAIWGVYRQPARWGWRIGLLISAVGGLFTLIGALLLWGYGQKLDSPVGPFLESMDWLDGLRLVFGIALFLAFTAACLALRWLYDDKAAQPPRIDVATQG